MELTEIKKAYKKCLNLRYNKRKTIPYKELDKLLYVVERYIEFVESV